MVKTPLFITGNQSKADYLAAMLGVTLEHRKVELDEIQARTLEEIVTHKVKQAYDIIQAPVLVEDVGLGFEALNGLPGPLIKFFVETENGLQILCSMLDGFENRGAIASCVYGYYDGNEVTLLRGELHGSIAKQPRGENGFGWDKIFEPIGYDGRTRAELNPDEDRETYMAIKPFAELRDFLKG